MFCTATLHVAEGCIASVSGIRVLAGAAGVGQVQVTAMGPTVDRIVVAASGSWGHVVQCRVL